MASREGTVRGDPAARWLAHAAALFALAALDSFVLLAVDAPPLLGVHPALKPLKFHVSIAVLLGSIAWVLPRVQVSGRARRAAAATLIAMMAIEILVIDVQAWRGLPSHFNEAGALNQTLWLAMIGAITVTSALFVWLALRATRAPLIADRRPLAAADASAWRFGLWLLALSALSGFAMGGLGRHTVGAADGGPGVWLLNWSVQHGDLRAAHFFALHALQALPLAAWLMKRCGTGEDTRLVWIRALGIALVTLHAVVLAGAALDMPLLALIPLLASPASV